MSSVIQKSQAAIPDSQYQSDLFWAAVMGVSPETFREKHIPQLKDNGMAVLTFGNRTFVRTVDFFAAIERRNAKEEKQKKGQR